MCYYVSGAHRGRRPRAPRAAALATRPRHDASRSTHISRLSGSAHVRLLRRTTRPSQQSAPFAGTALYRAAAGLPLRALLAEPARPLFGLAPLAAPTGTPPAARHRAPPAALPRRGARHGVPRRPPAALVRHRRLPRRQPRLRVSAPPRRAPAPAAAPRRAGGVRALAVRVPPAPRLLRPVREPDAAGARRRAEALHPQPAREPRRARPAARPPRVHGRLVPALRPRRHHAGPQPVPAARPARTLRETPKVLLLVPCRLYGARRGDRAGRAPRGL